MQSAKWQQRDWHKNQRKSWAPTMSAQNRNETKSKRETHVVRGTIYASATGGQMAWLSTPNPPASQPSASIHGSFGATISLNFRQRPNKRCKAICKKSRQARASKPPEINRQAVENGKLCKRGPNAVHGFIPLEKSRKPECSDAI